MCRNGADRPVGTLRNEEVRQCRLPGGALRALHVDPLRLRRLRAAIRAKPLVSSEPRPKGHDSVCGILWPMTGLLQYVDAVTFRVPDLDAGLAFYRERLGHELIWRNDAVGQAGLRTPDSATEVVLTTALSYEPNWKVRSAEDAAAAFVANGGRIVAGL